jgi:hypothetical protein
MQIDSENEIHLYEIQLGRGDSQDTWSPASLEDSKTPRRQVRFHSQWADPTYNELIEREIVDPCDDPLWSGQGFSSESEYRFWGPHGCALACLESILDYWQIEHPNRAGMIAEALNHQVFDAGGQALLGINSDAFSLWIRRRFKLDVAKPSTNLFETLLPPIFEDGFSIAIVAAAIRSPFSPRPTNSPSLGPMTAVLITDFDDPNVIFHSPSGFPPFYENVKMSAVQITKFYTGFGLSILKPK